MKLRALTLSQEGDKEINALSMIEKLFIVSQDPYEIWKAFEELRPAFFEKVLIRKYNIGENQSF
jgi:hypothetical protein